MDYKRAYIVTGMGIVVIAAACYMVNRAVNRIGDASSGQTGVSPARKGVDEKKKAASLTKEPRTAIKMSDKASLAKYGITITPRLSGPSSPEEWQDYVEENLKNNKVVGTPEAKEAIQAMQVTETEYKEKMKTIDEHIGIVKERLNENALDRKNRQKLQNIYKLKAVGGALKSMVVAPDDQFIAGVLNGTSQAPAAPSADVPSE